MKVKKVIACIVCLFIPLLIGGISGGLTASAIPTWYSTLSKPSFNPPNYLFGPVWTLLYILMGISLYLVWNSPQSALRKKALIIFAVQLAANFLWSILFFSMHLLFVSIIDILFMWALILSMIITFSKIKKVAGWMNIPYLLWVSFASVLNISFWWLNR